MNWIIQLFGRLHPLLVHLPIGILFLAFLFEVLSRFARYRKLGSAVQPALFWGSLFAIASVGSGYFLSQEGGYEERLLNLHQYMGIATAGFAVALYFIRLRSTRYFKDRARRVQARILMFLPLVVLLSITGHLGGSMTHGEEYLFEFATTLEQTPDPAEKLKTIADVNEAVLYRDVIDPIFSAKCYSCHSSKKRKGELRLDQIPFILQGGKHGAVIAPGIPDSSSLYSRLHLPFEDEHHMPPKESPQLSSSEIALIQVWIEEGASFDKKVGTYAQLARLKSYFDAMVASAQQVPLIPTETVRAADGKALAALKAKGVLILPLGSETNYLSVSFVNAAAITDADLGLLLLISDQLLWLDLGRTKVTDAGLNTVAKLSGLRQLHLEHTAVSDRGVAELSALTQLTYLNLVNTSITDAGLAHLIRLQNLRHLFIFQTKITAPAIEKFIKQSPGVKVDTGRYTLPSLGSDTVVFKRKS